MLLLQSNTLYPTNAATQEYIIQYNYKYQEKDEGEYFTTSVFFLFVPSS
jgi:hypothetical protein